jgi:DNA-binding NtrC family response regulator
MLPENDGLRSKFQTNLKDMMEEYERTLLLQALTAAAGHQRRAAAVLGILPTTLHEKMKRLGIPTRTGIVREEYRKASEAATATEAA